ncbi:unnamed protein product [Caretta caretta]
MEVGCHGTIWCGVAIVLGSIAMAPGCHDRHGAWLPRSPWRLVATIAMAPGCHHDSDFGLVPNVMVLMWNQRLSGVSRGMELALRPDLSRSFRAQSSLRSMKG